MQFRFIVLCGLLLPITAVEAATPFDGTYVGTIQMVGNGAAECTRNGQARVARSPTSTSTAVH